MESGCSGTLGRINWLWSNPGFAGKATSPGGIGTQGHTLGSKHFYPLPQTLHFRSLSAPSPGHVKAGIEGAWSEIPLCCLFHPYSTAQLSRRGWDTPIPKSCSLPDPGKSSPPSCPCGAAVTAPKCGHRYRNQAGKGKETQSTKRSARLQFTLRGAERAPVPRTAPRIIQSCHIEISLCIYL